MSIEHSRQCELASSVDHVVVRVRRKFSRLADRDDAAILDDQRAVADYSAARINSDEIVDVGNDEAGHRATNLLVTFFGNCCRIDLNRPTILMQCCRPRHRHQGERRRWNGPSFSCSDYRCILATGCGSDRISIVVTLSAVTVGFIIHKLNGPRADRLWGSGSPP